MEDRPRINRDHTKIAIAIPASLTKRDLRKDTTRLDNSLGTSLDINLSNASLVFISVTFATMCKSVAPIFLLIFAFAFRHSKRITHLHNIFLILFIFPDMFYQIPKDAQSRIFMPFMQADSSTSRMLCFHEKKKTCYGDSVLHQYHPALSEFQGLKALDFTGKTCYGTA
ncbi:hypothetical protein L1887_20181 [Cichorium endivia]|nr:hypothetical protein L1887_20181 [Cichorium endivia]